MAELAAQMRSRKNEVLYPFDLADSRHASPPRAIVDRSRRGGNDFRLDMICPELGETRCRIGRLRGQRRRERRGLYRRRSAAGRRFRGQGRADWRQGRRAARACVGPRDRRPNHQRAARARCRCDCALQYSHSSRGSLRPEISRLRSFRIDSPPRDVIPKSLRTSLPVASIVVRA